MLYKTNETALTNALQLWANLTEIKPGGIHIHFKQIFNERNPDQYRD